MRSVVTAVVTAVAAMLLSACAAGAPVASAQLPAQLDPITVDPVVEVDDNVFRPDPVTIEVGTTVLWTWVGRVAHDVVGDGFESVVQVEGEFSHTFEQVGVHPYVCRLHPGMEGEIVVAPSG